MGIDIGNLCDLPRLVTKHEGEALAVVTGVDFDFLLDGSVMDTGIRETLLEVRFSILACFFPARAIALEL